MWSQPPRFPTYRDVLNAAEDGDGDGFPDFFPQLRPGATVTIEDRILEVKYDEGYGPITLWFPYSGRWLYDIVEAAPAYADDDLGAYALNDTIRLVGSVRTWGNGTFEYILWRLPTDAPRPGPPTIVLENATIPGVQHAVRVAATSRAIATIHFAFTLFRDDQTVDRMALCEVPRGIFMDYHDGGAAGFMDAGDAVYFHGLDAGNYTLILAYASTEVSRLVFTETR